MNHPLIKRLRAQSPAKWSAMCRLDVAVCEANLELARTRSLMCAARQSTTPAERAVAVKMARRQNRIARRALATMQERHQELAYLGGMGTWGARKVGAVK